MLILQSTWASRPHGQSEHPSLSTFPFLTQDPHTFRSIPLSHSGPNRSSSLSAFEGGWSRRALDPRPPRPGELIGADSSGSRSGGRTAPQAARGELARWPRRGAVVAKRFVGGPGDAVEAFFSSKFFPQRFFWFFCPQSFVLNFLTNFCFYFFVSKFFAKLFCSSLFLNFLSNFWQKFF
jgi:hypothetical protein